MTKTTLGEEIVAAARDGVEIWFCERGEKRAIEITAASSEADQMEPVEMWVSLEAIKKHGADESLAQGVAEARLAFRRKAGLSE